MATYDDRLEKIINNNKISIKFDTARKYNEVFFKMKFDEFTAKA